MTCPYCRAAVTDQPAHAGQCPVLLMSLDPDAWPAGDELSERNKANVNKRKQRRTRAGGHWTHGRRGREKG